MDERDLMESIHDLCAECGHHRDAHEYETDTQGRRVYYRCLVPRCDCRCYVAPGIPGREEEP